MLMAIVGVSVPLALWSFVTDFFSADEAIDYLTTEVISAPFVHEVLERGEIESSSNVEIRCQVRSRNSSGVNIIEIVPEGATVKKDEFLVRLDDSGLQQELIQQQIICSNSESAVIEARATLAGARLALQEYEQGTFQEQTKQQESEVFVSKENVRRAEEYLRYSQRLAERGYISDVQVEADEFSLEKSRKELEVAQTKLTVLGTFTLKKMLTQLQADIDTSEARLKSKTRTWDLDKLRLQEIQDQIDGCTIVAPVGGQVVYANDNDRRSSSGDLLIAEGRPVRERQVIIRLPDPSKMQVIAKVHESRISFVRPGLKADLVLDAFSDQKLVGKVTAVSEYPIPSISVYMAHIKEYLVEIQIDSPPADLRPGMTAAVNIHVERLDEAIQIPIEAAIERGGRVYCAVPQSDGSLETREIQTGSSNEEHLVVTAGLTTGESVVMAVKHLEEHLDLPERQGAGSETGSP